MKFAAAQAQASPHTASPRRISATNHPAHDFSIHIMVDEGGHEVLTMCEMRQLHMERGEEGVGV